MEASAEVPGRMAGARKAYAAIKAELARVVVGHDALIEQVFISLVCGGHCLLEGVPGLGKTLMVRSLAAALNLSFSRIQFTPDLMPADITGTQMLTEDAAGEKKISTSRGGPISPHIGLADETTRATPKTQSALLEAMQEQSVTVAGKGHRLESPFMVLATQNPIEMEGTYPLPEAQVDRFFFKLLLEYPGRAELARIADLPPTQSPAELNRVLDGESILKIRDWVREGRIWAARKNYAARLILATHPHKNGREGSAEKYV